VSTDAQPLDPLAVTEADLGRGSPIPLVIVPDHAALVERFAADLLAEYAAARRAGRRKVVFIVPVGPVGQFDVLARQANAGPVSLRDLVVINMDEYLTADGRDWIPDTDALSFRRHMAAHFYDLLDPALAPPPEQRIFPHPGDVGAVQRAIHRWEGVDVCFAGVGITGHLAFNEPPEPGEPMSVDELRQLPTRVVRLSRETRLVNALNAARGNLDRIPALAVTVGMREILASRRIRVYMNREWQGAIVRKVLHGPVTPAVPASLLQEHPDVRLTIAAHVARLPEPELR
jgi:glucosamine-6-phosphate deaminase